MLNGLVRLDRKVMKMMAAFRIYQSKVDIETLYLARIHRNSGRRNLDNAYKIFTRKQ